MSYRITVKDSRGTVAREEIFLRDADDDQDVVAAAATVCKTVGQKLPKPARILVEESVEAHRWRTIRNLVV